MTPVVWHPTRDRLTAALISATGDDLTIGTAQLARLDAFGDAYDAAYGATADTSKNRVNATYASALALWLPRASLSHAQADRTARFCESLQVSANASAGVLPAALFNKAVLAPNTAGPFAFPEAASAAAGASVTSVGCTLTGSVNLLLANLSALSGTDITITVTANGVPHAHHVAFGTVVQASALPAALQVGGAGAILPYIDASGRLVLRTAGFPVSPDPVLSLVATSGTALPLLGFTTGQASGPSASSTLLFTAKATGPMGNAITATVGPSSDELLAHFDLAVQLDGYVEVYRSVDPIALPSLGSSNLLGPLAALTTPTGRPPDGVYALAGGAGGNHAALDARIARALTFPATVSAGQTAPLEAHQALLDLLYAEFPVLEQWGALVDIPVSGVSVLVPTQNGRIDVFALEQALVAEVAATNNLLTSF